MLRELVWFAKEVTKVAVAIPYHAVKGDLVSEKGLRHDLKEGFYDGLTSDRHWLADRGDK